VVLSIDPKTPLLVDHNYRITARGVRNLLGKSHEVTRTFTVPKPPKPKPDSTHRTPADTTHRTPADTARRRPPPR
jgi:hypothetical protein